jgi:hypothetical protein
MKRSPQQQKLDTMLRSSKIVAGGFMGIDTRNVEEIIEADKAELDRLGYNHKQIANKLQQITDRAVEALGNPVKIDENLTASVDEAKGPVICPWPHPGRFAKRVTTVTKTNNNKQIKYSDLCIHLIGEHGFFQGKGSFFRLEPRDVIDTIF